LKDILTITLVNGMKRYIDLSIC